MRWSTLSDVVRARLTVTLITLPRRARSQGLHRRVGGAILESWNVNYIPALAKGGEPVGGHRVECGRPVARLRMSGGSVK